MRATPLYGSNNKLEVFNIMEDGPEIIPKIKTVFFFLYLQEMILYLPWVRKEILF